MAKAENANNLGAPASGFGQNVSFAFQPGEVPSEHDVSRATPVVAGSINADNVGIRDNSVQAAHLPDDHAFQALMDAGMEIMGPKVKEARTKAFVAGMQSAAQGEAVKDIVDKQPWYSRIFGDSDFVSGARSYSGHAQAAVAAGALEDQMPELRKMDPAQVQQVMVKTIMGAQTGDPVTDAQIMKTMTAQLPALMRRQAKENYAYRQDQASQAEAHSMMSGAKQLQTAAGGMVAEVQDDESGGHAGYAPGATSPEQFKVQSDAFVRSIVPVAGRDLTNWQLNTAKTMKDMARGGMFHALNAIESKGGMEALTEDQRASVQAVRDTEEKQQRALNEAPYLQQIAQIKAGVKFLPDGSTPASFVKRMQDVNNAYQTRTGSKLGMFTPEQMVSISTEGLETVYRDRRDELKKSQALAEKGQTQALKDQAAARSVVQTAGLLEAGTSLPPGTSDADKTGAWMQLRATNPERYFKATAAAYQGGERAVDPETKNLMLGAINGSISVNDPKPLMDMYTQLYLPMISGGVKDKSGQWSGTAGEQTAMGYLGEDMGKKMRIFHTYMKQGQSAAAMTNAFVLPTISARISVTDKDDQKVVKEVESRLSYYSPEWFGTPEEHGNIDLRADQSEFIAGLVKHKASDLRINDGDWKAATGQALNSLRGDGGQGLQVLGGYGWLNPSGSSRVVQSLSSGADPVPTNRVADMLRDTLKERIVAAGADPSDRTQIVRYADGPGGDAQFVALVTNKDGEVKYATLTGSQVRAAYKANKTKKVEQKAAVEAAQDRLAPGYAEGLAGMSIDQSGPTY